jgi:hypothetical protein
MAKRGPKPDQEQRQQAVALYATGLTLGEVGQRLGVSAYLVGRILREAGVEARRGFGTMDPERLRAICAAAGRAAHAKGTAHEFTSEEAAAAGAKGGKAAHERGTAHIFTPAEARAAGRKSSRVRGAKAEAGGQAEGKAAEAPAGDGG